MTRAVSKRLHKALDLNPAIPATHGRSSAFAKAIKERPSTVRLWLTKDKYGVYGMPDVKKLRKISLFLDVTIDWILTGTGSMRPGSIVDDDMIDIDELEHVLAALHQFMGKRFYAGGFSKQSKIITILYRMQKNGEDIDQFLGNIDFYKLVDTL